MDRLYTVNENEQEVGSFYKEENLETSQSRANSIDESFFEINIDLKRYLEKRKVTKSESMLNNIVDRQLSYLKNNSLIVNQREKSDEMRPILEESRFRKTQEISKFKNVKSKLSQDRNPNVRNILKDISDDDERKRDNNELTLNSLQDSLKNEFSVFLNSSVDSSLENVKKVNSDGGRTLRRRATTSRERRRIFLTQQDDEIDQELADILDKSSSRMFEKPAEKHEAKIDESNMKVAVILEENEANAGDNSQKAVIRLKKMIDAIKKVDLPKFQTELHQICQYGADPQLFKFYPEDVEFNLEKKQNDLGRYCIHECCIKGNIQMLTGLLKYIADVNTVDNNGQNAAHICAKHGELACLRLLAANGIDLRCGDTLGMEPIHVAAYYNQARIVEFLFDMGVPVVHCYDQSGKVPLHWACERGALEAVRAISSCGADVDLSAPDQSDEANTGAHLSARADRLECLQLLHALGLPLERLRNSLGRTLAHVCCLYGSLKCLHWLLETFSFKFLVDNKGNTLAHCCCMTGQAECLNCCIQHDFSIFERNKLGETPLELARKSGKGLQIQNAIRNQIRCDECVEIAKRIKWEKEHEKTEGEKIVEKNKDAYYDFSSLSPNTNLLTTRSDRLPSKHKNANAEIVWKRDLIAQYFGPEI